VLLQQFTSALRIHYTSLLLAGGVQIPPKLLSRTTIIYMIFSARSSVFAAVVIGITSVCISAIVLWPRVAVPNESLEGLDEKILSTTQRLKELDAEIQQSRELKKKLDKALKASNEKVNERQTRINQLKQDIKNYNQQLDRLDVKILDEQGNVELRKQVLAQSIRRAQRVSSGRGLKVVLQNDNPAAANRLGVYTTYFMEAQRHAIMEQQTILQKLEAARNETVKNRNWLNYIKKKATSQYDTYKSQSEKNQQSLGEVQAQITNKTRTVATLKVDQARLQALVEELRKTQVAESGYFVSRQGDYPLPVAGTIKARFGEVKTVGKLRWDGYFIEAGSGEPVQAIADGAVVYSDWLQGFGMLVILDHGDGYMTLYGGNRDVAVQNEDWVQTGATIATVGDSGGQKTSGVYFEIRHNAVPLDPKEWISAENSIKTVKK